jgi:hypothetical protein
MSGGTHCLPNYEHSILNLHPISYENLWGYWLPFCLEHTVGARPKQYGVKKLLGTKPAMVTTGSPTGQLFKVAKQMPYHGGAVGSSWTHRVDWVCGTWSRTALIIAGSCIVINYPAWTLRTAAYTLSLCSAPNR